MSKKNRPTDSGGSWMDTYGDMVTLLLTFLSCCIPCLTWMQRNGLFL